MPPPGMKRNLDLATMDGKQVQRRLAAILAADVVGYSRLMGQDEGATLARLKALRREIVHPAVTRHSGTVVKTTGDGWLLDFPARSKRSSSRWSFSVSSPPRTTSVGSSSERALKEAERAAA